MLNDPIFAAGWLAALFICWVAVEISLPKR